jgi:type I restriction enzyme R subunit
MLRGEPGFVRLREQVKDLAGLLEEKSAIPMVRERMAFIQDVQTEAWWQDVTVPMLEGMRRRLRDLIKLIDKQKRKPIYTDFADAMGEETAVALPGFGEGTDYARFRAKAQAFLRAHQDHVAIHKLRMNKALTAADLAELERMLAESGVGGADEIELRQDAVPGAGALCALAGRHGSPAAKEAFTGFLAGKTLGANQIEFVNLIVTT